MIDMILTSNLLSLMMVLFGLACAYFSAPFIVFASFLVGYLYLMGINTVSLGVVASIMLPTEFQGKTVVDMTHLTNMLEYCKAYGPSCYWVKGTHPDAPNQYYRVCRLTRPTGNDVNMNDRLKDSIPGSPW